MNEPQLLSFKASRRAIGLAVFTGLTLECTFVRELSADDRKAKTSTRAFLRWALETFPTDAVLVEEALTLPGSRAWVLSKVMRDEVGLMPQPCLVSHPANVLARRDRPRRIPRQELRTMARILWPSLLARPCNPVALDAAILGLHQQANVLFEA